MSNNSPNKSTPIFLMLLMVLAPFASANVTTFSDGSDAVDIEIRDGNDLANLVDGNIDLPDGETVTSASMTVSTSMVEHGAQSRIDLDTIPRVWNPNYNNQLTQFSNIAHFQIEDGTTATPVRLAAEGFLTDFEGTTAGFMDATNPGTMPNSGIGWDHGTLGPNNMPNGCKSGNECWGTNLADDNYTDDNGGVGFKVAMHSADLFVDPLLKSKIAYFDSWHSLEVQAGVGTNSKHFPDCAYLEIRSSPNPGFPPDDMGFEYLPIDQSNSTGISFGTNYAQGGGNSGTTSGNGRISTSCSGLQDTTSGNWNYGLAGSSTTANNPSGWATVAVDLTDKIGDYVQIRFVMHHTGRNSPNLEDNMSGWVIDNFRLGDLLPQNASMTVRGMTPSVLGGSNHPNG